VLKTSRSFVLKFSSLGFCMWCFLLDCIIQFIQYR